MSGPKVVSVEVQRAQALRRELDRMEAERRAARRRQLQARAKALSDQLRRLSERWKKASRDSGDVFTAWPYEGVLRDLTKCAGDHRRGNDRLRAVLDDLAQRVSQAEREFAQQSSLSRFRASFQKAIEAQAADAAAAARSAEAEKAERNEREMRQCAEEVSRLLETLAAEVPEESRTAIEKRAEETISSPMAFRRNALLAQLHLDIQRANKSAAERRRLAVQVEQLREKLLGLQGPEIDELNRKLQQVVHGQSALADLGRQVEDAVARARQAEDRDYALAVITEELENLGYVVDEGFETASAQNSEVLLRNPAMDDGYHVSLRAEGALLHNRVVREAGELELDHPLPRSADRESSDRAMESTWCRDLAAALAAAESKGVRGRVVSRKRVGEVPVRAIAALKNKLGAKRKRKRRRTGQLRSRVRH